MPARYCEFVGDASSPWDGPKKQRCEHIGYAMPAGHYKCLKHGEAIDQDAEGWMRCCGSCTKPIQEKDDAKADTP